MASFAGTLAGNSRSRVLIVDDDMQTRRLLDVLLQSEGLETALAENGQQTLEVVKTFKPHLILLDLIMPGMTGFEVVTKLKADSDTRSIPIILVSALEDRTSRLQGLKAGAEEFLTKPIDHTDLQIRVRNLLQLKKFNDFLEMGYPYKCGKAKMPGWKQRNRKFVQRLVLITQETTLTFSAGFLMMLPALITLTGCVGRLVFRAQHVRAGRGGA